MSKKQAVLSMIFFLSLLCLNATNDKFKDNNVWTEDYLTGQFYNHWETEARNTPISEKEHDQEVKLYAISKDKRHFILQRYLVYAEKVIPTCHYPLIDKKNPAIMSLAICKTSDGICEKEWMIYDFKSNTWPAEDRRCTKPSVAKKRLSSVKMKLQHYQFLYGTDHVINLKTIKGRDDNYTIPHNIKPLQNGKHAISIFWQHRVELKKNLSDYYDDLQEDMLFTAQFDLAFCLHETNDTDISNCVSFDSRTILQKDFEEDFDEKPIFDVKHMAIDKDASILFIWLKRYVYRTKYWNVIPEPRVVHLNPLYKSLLKQ